MTTPGLHLVTGEVTALVANPRRIPASDLDVALSGHAALLNLLQTMHRSLTGNIPLPTHVVQPKDIDRSPVVALGHLLHQHPHSVPLALSDVLTTTSSGRWRELARHATVALYVLPDRLSPDTTSAAAWSDMADLAALSRALTVLDGDIARSLNPAGRIVEAATYRRAGHSGLRVAAEGTLRVARRGRLTTGPVRHPHHRAVLTVPVPAAIPVAIDRLAHLVTETAITPAHMDQIVSTLAKTGLAAATALTSAGEVDAASTLADTANALASAAPFSRRIKQLDGGDALAFIQAQQIETALAQMADCRSILPTSVARTIAPALRSTVTAVAAAADDQAASGRWLTVDDSRTSLTWKPCRPGEAAPGPLLDLRNCADRARLLPAASLPKAAATPPPIRQQITEVLARRPTPTRPAWPGRRRGPTR